jgi:hypothetical protein
MANTPLPCSSRVATTRKEARKLEVTSKDCPRRVSRCALRYTAAQELSKSWQWQRNLTATLPDPGISRPHPTKSSAAVTTVPYGQRPTDRQRITGELSPSRSKTASVVLAALTAVTDACLPVRDAQHRSIPSPAQVSAYVLVGSFVLTDFWRSVTFDVRSVIR